MKIDLPISLVIPCYNRVDGTKDLLDSLRDSKFRCQIIIIDDCSNLDISGLISKYKDLDIIYQRNEVNKGPAFSRNRGIELSDFDLVAFTDNDCQVTDNWLINLYETIIDSSENIAGVGGRVISRSNDLFSLYYVYHKILDPFFFKGQYLYLVTANAIFKKSALLKVSCFDETVSIAGGEDPGLCFKLINKGYKFQYNPQAIIIHDFPKGIRSFARSFYRYGFGCSYQSMKYYEEIPFFNNDQFARIDGN